MEKVEPALVPQRKLSNGMVIPGIGMGTFGNDRFSAELMQCMEQSRRATVCSTVRQRMAMKKISEKSSKKHFPMESYRDRI